METLEEIYSQTQLNNTYIYLGDYFKKDKILDLIKVLFNFFLRSQVNQEIIYVGDYSNILLLGYYYASNTLYNKYYTESILLLDITRIFSKNFESPYPNITRTFVEEYTRRFEAYFLLSKKYILLNLSYQEYIIGELRLQGRELRRYYSYGQPYLGNIVITSIYQS